MAKQKARRKAKRCPGVGQAALESFAGADTGRCPVCQRIVAVRMPGGAWKGRVPVIVLHSPLKPAPLKTQGTWFEQFERIHADVAEVLALLPDVDGTLQVKSSTLSEVLGSLKALSIMLHGDLPQVAEDVDELAAKLERETERLNYLRSVPAGN